MNELNGRIEAFDTMPVELEVTCVDGQFTRKISALKIDRVHGNLAHYGLEKRIKQV